MSNIPCTAWWVNLPSEVEAAIREACNAVFVCGVQHQEPTDIYEPLAKAADDAKRNLAGILNSLGVRK